MKLLKKAAALLLAPIMLFGCSSTPTAQEESTPAESVTNYLNDFKNGDLVEADDYLASDAMSTYSISQNLDTLDEIFSNTFGLDDESVELVKEATLNLTGAMVSSYKIDSENVDGDTATVDVTITGPTLEDINTLQSDEIINAISEAITSGGVENGIDSTVLGAGLDALVEKVKELSTTDYSATFTLVDENGEWKISSIDGFLG